MGRIKTKLSKRIGRELVDIHKNILKSEFSETKLQVAKMTNVKSKKMRNVIAGYVTRLMKHREEI